MNFISLARARDATGVSVDSTRARGVQFLIEEEARKNAFIISLQSAKLGQQQVAFIQLTSSYSTHLLPLCVLSLRVDDGEFQGT